MKKGEVWKMPAIMATFGLALFLVLASCATAGGGRMFPPVKTVSSGNAFGVGIGIDGSLWSVGNNSDGQLGNGSFFLIPRRSPVRIGTDYNWASVSVGPGGSHVAAIRTDGSLWAWGNNNRGQLGDGTIARRTRPIRIGTGWASVSAGNSHTVAIRTDGSLWAWGNNNRGQLGDGTWTNRHTPVRIGWDTDWVYVSAGSSHTVAIRTNGSLWAWGSNGWGQIGDGTITTVDHWGNFINFNDHHTPIRIGADYDWGTVSAGAAHTVAIRADGSLWVWGRNLRGQFGNGTISNRADNPSPIRVGMNYDWASVSTDINNTFAIRTDGTLWAWGDNEEGWLGDGTRTDRLIPTQIGWNTNWASVSRSTAVRTDYSVWAWGPLHGNTPTLIGTEIN